MTHVNAKEYSLKSPTGEVFLLRSLTYFIRQNMDLFQRTDRGKATISLETIRTYIACLVPKKVKNKLAVWQGWTWYNESAYSRTPRRVILSLGSNIEPRLEWIDKAVEALSALPNVRDVRRSPLYETVPDDVPEQFRDQPYLNGIVTLEASMHPLKLLKATQAIERRLGRKRNGVHGSPRTIDIDIIAIDNVRVARPELLVPHPRAMTRRFVLQPLADLLPDFRFPGQTQTVSDLLRQLDDAAGAN